MKILKKIFYLALIGSAVSSACAGIMQECDDTGIRSTPTADFIFNGDGTVFHKKTGLTWMQCPFTKYGLPDEQGGVYKPTINGNCYRIHDYTIYQAPIEVPKLIDKLRKTKGGEHWRLPTIKELASLQEDHCVNPPLNLKVFKMTPRLLFNANSFFNQFNNYGFLTSTIYANYSDKVTKAGRMATPVYFSFPVSPLGPDELNVDQTLAKQVGAAQHKAIRPDGAQLIVLLVRDDK